jgi:hypothetical protein
MKLCEQALWLTSTLVDPKRHPMGAQRDPSAVHQQRRQRHRAGHARADQAHQHEKRHQRDVWSWDYKRGLPRVRHGISVLRWPCSDADADYIQMSPGCRLRRHLLLCFVDEGLRYVFVFAFDARGSTLANSTSQGYCLPASIATHSLPYPWARGTQKGNGDGREGS